MQHPTTPAMQPSPWLHLGWRYLVIIAALLLLLPLGERTLKGTVLRLAATGALDPQRAEAPWDRSWVSGRPVPEVVAERLPATLQLVALAGAVALGPLLLVNWLSCRVQNPWLEQLLMLPGLIAAFVPVPVLGLALLGAFLRSGQIPVSGLLPGSLILGVFLFGSITAALQGVRYAEETPGLEWLPSNASDHPAVQIPGRQLLARATAGLGWLVPLALFMTLVVEQMVGLGGIGQLLRQASHRSDLPVLWTLLKGMLVLLVAIRLLADLAARCLLSIKPRGVAL